MKWNIFVSFKPPRPGIEPRKAAVLTTTLVPPPSISASPIRWQKVTIPLKFTPTKLYSPVSSVLWGGGLRVVVSTAAFHARVRGSVPGLGGLKETKMFLPHPRVKISIVGSLRDREVAYSASDRQGSNFESCVWRTVSAQSSHHPQEVLLAQFSLYVHKGGLKPDSFHFLCPLFFKKTLFLEDSFLVEKNQMLCLSRADSVPSE